MSPNTRGEKDMLKELHALLRAAPMGIGLVSASPERLILQANERLCRMTGYAESELIGQSARMLYPDDEQFEKVGRKKYAQIRAAGVGAIETIFRCKDGSLIDIMLSSAFLNPENPGAGTVFAAVDITERKRTEKALSESEERYRTIFDESIDAIFIHDAEGRILEVNRMACVQCGYSREELLKLKVFDLHPSETKTINLPRDEIVRQWSRWLPGQRHVLVAEHRRKDGGIFPVQVSTGVIRWKNAFVFLAVVHDITDRMQAEKKIREQLEELRRWHKATMGREGRILELKREVNELLNQAGKPPRYTSALSEEGEGDET